MVMIHCASIAEFVNLDLKDTDDVTVSVNLSSPNAKDDIAERCMKFLTTSFTNSLPEQVEKFIEYERSQNYTVTFEDSKQPFDVAILSRTVYMK